MQTLLESPGQPDAIPEYVTWFPDIENLAMSGVDLGLSRFPEMEWMLSNFNSLKALILHIQNLHLVL
jgi:hypothetical protein